ncbi:unnamed protein product [Sphagnum troendelagicum]
MDGAGGTPSTDFSPGTDSVSRGDYVLMYCEAPSCELHLLIKVSDLKNIAGILASTVLLMEFDGICHGQFSNFDGSSISGPGQERAGEGLIHTAVTRTVVNLVPLQGAQSPVVGAQIAKACGSVYIQGSPQEKVLIPHFTQRPGLQDCVIPLPKPLTVTEADKAEGQVLENGKKSHEDLPSPEVYVVD